MKLNQVWGVALVALCGAVLSLKAQTTVELGGVQIDIPDPVGFKEATAISADAKKLAESFTPPTNKLLALYLSDAQWEDLKKGTFDEWDPYMMVQAFRAGISKDLSRKEFSEIATVLRSQQKSLMDQVKTDGDKLLDNAAKDITEGTDVELKLKINNVVPLGIFLEEDDCVSFATLTNFDMKSQGEDTAFVMATAVNFVRVKSRLLYLYVYKKYEAEEDADWVRMKSKEWVDELLNPSKRGVGMPE